MPLQPTAFFQVDTSIGTMASGSPTSQLPIALILSLSIGGTVLLTYVLLCILYMHKKRRKSCDNGAAHGVGVGLEGHLQRTSARNNHQGRSSKRDLKMPPMMFVHSSLGCCAPGAAGTTPGKRTPQPPPMPPPDAESQTVRGASPVSLSSRQQSISANQRRRTNSVISRHRSMSRAISGMFARRQRTETMDTEIVDPWEEQGSDPVHVITNKKPGALSPESKVKPPPLPYNFRSCSMQKGRLLSKSFKKDRSGELPVDSFVSETQQL